MKSKQTKFISNLSQEIEYRPNVRHVVDIYIIYIYIVTNALNIPDTS